MKHEIKVVIREFEQQGYYVPAAVLEDYGLSPRDARNTITEINKRNRDIKAGKREGQVILLHADFIKQKVTEQAKKVRLQEELECIQFLKELSNTYEQARF